MAAEFTTLHLELQPPLARIRLARPESRNALSLQLQRELMEALEAVALQPGARALILEAEPTPHGPIFSVGADLRDAALAAILQGSSDARRGYARFGAQLCRRIETLEMATVAALDGPVYGGGLSLALACDFRVAGPTARLAVPEVDRGMNYGWGSTARLWRLVGPARARAMILLGEAVEAPTALAWGLVSRLAEADAVGTAAETLALQLAGKPPLALSAAKRALGRLEAPPEALESLEAEAFAHLTGTSDFFEAIASFLEKRPPRYQGR